MSSNIQLYDVTLRDGAQTEGISFSVKDKLRILKLLDELGMNYIEGGWPGANPKDTELFNLMKSEKLSNAILVAFGSTRRAGQKAEDSPILKNLIEAETQHVNIFAKGWDFHVTEALKISLEQNLEIIYDSLTYLKKYVPSVALGVEHFFDGYKANPDYVKKVIKTAQEAGAEWVSAADTNGGCLVEEVGDIITEVRKDYEILKSVHIHQDSGLAIAATMKAIDCGVTIVHGTINGIGERCGMTDFCTLIPNLKFKKGIDVVSDEQLKKLREVALVVAESGGFQVQKFSPYVGESAFYHKGGVHVDAVLKNPKTYNHIEPDKVGNEYTTAVSELSGKANIMLLAKKYGIQLDKGDPRILKLLNFIKEQENYGFQYDGAAATRFLLFKQFLEGYETKIRMESFDFLMKKSRTEKFNSVLDERASPEIEATIKICVDDNCEQITVTNKKGPLAALAQAVKEGLNKKYDNMFDRIKIVDLKIRVLDYTHEGNNIHKMRLLLGVKDFDTDETYYTVGASHDIYSAFLKALIDAVEYKIIKTKKNT
jgi:2-isopropylmalate synthase